MTPRVLGARYGAIGVGVSVVRCGPRFGPIYPHCFLILPFGIRLFTQYHFVWASFILLLLIIIIYL